MSAVGDAGIGGDPTQFEKAMILGDDFVDGRRSDDANAFFEQVHKNLWFKGSTFRVQRLRRLGFRIEKIGIHDNSETANAG